MKRNVIKLLEFEHCFLVQRHYPLCHPHIHSFGGGGEKKVNFKKNFFSNKIGKKKKKKSPLPWKPDDLLVKRGDAAHIQSSLSQEIHPKAQ